MEDLIHSYTSVSSSTSSIGQRPQHEARKPLRARPGSGNLHRPSQPIRLTDNEFGTRRKPKEHIEGTFDISEYMDKRGHEDFTNVWEEIDVSHVEDRLNVSKKLWMKPMEKNPKFWEGFIELFNRTKLNVSYKVLSTGNRSYGVEPELGWMLPNTSKKIRVFGKESHLQDILYKNSLTVLASPVYFEAQLDRESLKEKWDKLESSYKNWNSFECEAHQIKCFYPYARNK